MPGTDSPARFTERKLVILVVDLARSTRAVSRFGAVELAEFFDAFYGLCGQTLPTYGGRIVSFIGDGCLVVFEEGEGQAAIDAARDLAGGIDQLSKRFGVDVELGANIHQSVVAEGEFAPDGKYNIMGTGVFHTFLMGNGPGVRISEPVYRQLANDRRGAWSKNRPPATYTLTEER